MEIKKIGVISLGCAKNRVDCEVMMKKIQDAGFEFCENEAECDAIIVNTCAFIETAKEEAIRNILDAAAYKALNLKKLIVTGCLAERYKEEIFSSIPEVDAILGVKSFDEIVPALLSEEKFSCFKPLSEKSPEGERLITTENYSVYLKIAEGCSNRCSYCVIPYIRGNYQYRETANIINEAKVLAARGAVEINVISQDTSRHPELIKIIRGICEIQSVKWVRLLYLYPDEISDDLIAEIKNQSKVVKYIDLPLQHASSPVLKRMNRRGNQKKYSALIGKIRREIPSIALRTTFITGFPGEKNSDFKALCEFVRKIKFENMGVFTYSREEGTPAAGYCGQIDKRMSEKRAETLMEIQYGLLDKINKKYLGKVFPVLCEGIENDHFVGRAYFQAPEVDGKIFFKSKNDCQEGQFYNGFLVKYDTYDFYGFETV